MQTVTIHAAKTYLSKLIERVEAGEEIVIARGKRPVARLVPMNVPAHVLRSRTFGALKGKFGLPDAFFFDPLPAAEVEAWEDQRT
jgi:prevent-host-death family protein